MTELEMRKTYVDKAVSFLNCNESDGSFRAIIDLYNSISPLPAGYKMSYSDAWCAAFVSAVAHACGFTKFIFPECSCDRMIKKYMNAGRWQENDAYRPQSGDIIMYDWDDSGVGDNVGSADHVGIVVEVNGQQIKIVEGNVSDKVGYRCIMIDGKNIRGYCLPDFAGNAVAASSLSNSESVQPTSSRAVLKLGMKGEDVRELQKKLITLGYSCGSAGADGEFGNATQSAVIRYQRQKGLTADGEAGPLTMASINSNSGAFSETAFVKSAASGENNEKIIWDYLMSVTKNEFAAAGIMGNFFAESGLNPKNLQNSYEKHLVHSDDSYTAAVDNGTYTNFVNDAAGYGLAQWTFWSRKKGLLEQAQSKGVSIGDLQMQLEYMYYELRSEHSGLLNSLRDASSVRDASTKFMIQFEQPYDQGIAAQNTRAEYSDGYYEKYHHSDTGTAGNGELVVEEKAFAPKVGDIVRFIGSKHYLSSGSLIGSSCRGGVAKITSIAAGARHPYHLVKTADGGSTVYGWVNQSDIEAV